MNSKTESTRRTGGRILVDQLIAQGVERLTCVPGESYLAVLDALHDAAVDVLVCRAEGGAAMMAEAYGKLTGRPGVCFVTRGPGATNASPGVHIAAQDSTPMILFIGQVARGMREREAFQEVDYKQFFGSMAKWVVEVDDAARLPELIARAFRVAMQGRPGPVVVSLPEDVLTDEVAATDAPRVEPVEIWPGPDQMARLRSMLEEAERPLVIAGGTRWTPEARAALVTWSERFGLPVATSFRRAHLFPADHPRYAGDVGIGPNPKLAARIKAADLLDDRRPPLGDAILLLYPPEHPGPGPKTRARPSRRGGTGARLSARARHRGLAGPVLRRARGNARPAGGALGRTGCGGSRRIPGLVRDAGRSPRIVPVRPRCRVASRQAARRRCHLQRRGQLRDLDPSLLPVLRLRNPTGPNLRIDWATASPRP